MLLFRGTVLTVVVLAACGLIYWQWFTGHAYYFLEVVYSIMTGRRFKKKKNSTTHQVNVS